MEFAETMAASGVSIAEQAFERAEAEFDQQCILAEIHTASGGTGGTTSTIPTTNSSVVAPHSS